MKVSLKKLEKNMQIKTAFILCAGFGKRLNPLTLKTPKPLLNLYDKTLLEHTLNLIKKLNINKVKINTFYLKEKIENFIMSKNFDLEIDIINDGEYILDTGGGILKMSQNINEENFLVLNPDTYWDENYVDIIKKMENFYHDIKAQNILLIVNKNLSFDKRLIGDFNFEKKYLNKGDPRNFVYTGCQILNRNILTGKNVKKFSINEIWNDMIKKNRLIGYESTNKFIHITDLEIYQNLSKN